MTEPVDPALLQRWNATLRAARAGREGPDPAPYGRNLLTRWAEPQRRYHTVDHLRAVLDRIDELADLGGEGGELELVRLAAWFHDAVYRPDRSENEERSAVLAEKALAEAGLTSHEVAEVARLVRLTTTHDPAPGDLNGEALCDADLAILATDEDTYGGYTRAVREEYAFVPDDDFRQGRAAVLGRLLSLPRLFRTPYGAAAWEERARRNLARELKELGA
ncbi:MULTISPECIES: HD domain-containing protein [unclassified Streptomyces]|uniref:HD domain-containing protein n=1 Tax=Streptomyces sp. NPDC127129 TaxID=3345373 RepID=UPI0036324A5B